MPADPDRVTLEGSEHPPVPGERSLGPLPADTVVDVTVHLRPPRDPEEARRAALGAAATAASGPAERGSGAGRRFLTRGELAELRGASEEDLAAVQAFAAEHGLDVLESSRAGRRVRLRGPAGAVGAAFGVELERFEHAAGTHRGHRGPVRLPPALHERVVAVLGLDDRPQARSRIRFATETPSASYTPVEVATAYGLPASASAGGVCVGIVELGGGYESSDLDSYFSELGLAVPAVTAVGVDGAANSPSGNPNSSDAEVLLDIEVIGAIATGASIAVYFAPNTDQGFADAISTAAHDDSNHPLVLSISWGGPESTYTSSAVTAFENALSDAALVGMSVFVASGDSGSSDGVDDGLAHVDYPASSPQVTGCGGTTLRLAQETIVSEVAWDELPSGGATGGGVSVLFPVPSWQQHAGVPPSANPGGGAGRGVPDVAGNADPDTGYEVRVDGQQMVVGGTSAVAPLWAAATALAVASGRSPLGLLNPTLYASGESDFHDITEGGNGAYTAGAGWDPCTGLGSPRLADVLAALDADSSNDS